MRNVLFQNLDLYIYKNSIKMTDIGLTAKIGDSTTKFEIWFRKRKPNDTFTLQSMSEEIKQVWTEEISKLLWKQALRNRGMFLVIRIVHQLICRKMKFLQMSKRNCYLHNQPLLPDNVRSLCISWSQRALWISLVGSPCAVWELEGINLTRISSMYSYDKRGGDIGI